MTLQQQLETIRQGLESRMPKVALDIMHQATDELIASGQADKIAAVGSTFPDFTLNDHAEQSVSLSDILAKGPLVLTWYRGLWCPYCNADLAYMGTVHEEISASGAQLFAISPQPLLTRSKSVKKII